LRNKRRSPSTSRKEKLIASTPPMPPMPHVYCLSHSLPSNLPPPLMNETEKMHNYLTPCTSSHRAPSDVLVDGSISYTFGPRAAEVYFGYLLKGSIRRSQLSWDVPTWPGACFTSQGVNAIAETSSSTCHKRRVPVGLKARLLDYDVRNLEGAVVPQVLWSPQSQGAMDKYVLGATLQFPIFFVRQDRAVGLTLHEAIETPREILGAETYAPLGGQSTLHVRIQVRGLLYDSCPCSLCGHRGTVASPGRKWRANLLMTSSCHHSGLDIGYGSVKYRHATTRA